MLGNLAIVGAGRSKTYVRSAELIAAAFVVAATACNAHAQSRADNWKYCAAETDVSVDLQIGGCTALIQSGQETSTNLAIIFTNRGISHASKGENERALADYTQAIRINDKYSPAYNSRGIIHRRNKNDDLALADFNQAISLNSKFFHAFNNRGQIYGSRNDYNKALADYSQAISINPKYVVALNNRGLLYRSNKEYDNALADYDQAITLSPQSAHLYDNRGDVYLAQKKYDRAIESYGDAIRLGPTVALYRYDRAHAYRARWADPSKTLEDRGRIIRDDKNAAAQLDHARMMEDLDEAIRLQPTFFQALNYRCEFYLLKREYDRAFEDCNRSVAINPKNTFGVGLRATGNLWRGLLDEAIADATLAISLSPDNPSPLNTRGNAYSRRNKGNDIHLALADYTKADAVSPGNALYFVNRGLAYMIINEYRYAIEDFTNALKIDPEYVDALAERARAHGKAGDTSKAEEDSIAAAVLRDKLASKINAP